VFITFNNIAYYLVSEETVYQRTKRK